MAGNPSKFSQMLAAAIAERDLPLDRITARLRAAGKSVSAATLSYWQTGRSLPTRARSMETLVELERILWLPPGTLITALPESNPRLDPRRLLPNSNVSSSLLTEVSLELAQTWSKVNVWDRLHIRPDHSESHLITRQVLRAKVDGAQTLLLVLHQDGKANVPPTVECVFGYELQGIQILPEENVAIARFSLPSPVAKGTMVTTEHIVRWQGQSAPTDKLERSTADLMASLILEVEFEGEMPQKLESCTRSFDSAGPQLTAKVTPQGCWARSIVTQAKPGIHSLNWQW